MKIIITENRRNNVVTKWLDDNYGELEKYVAPGSYRFTHYKDSNGDRVLIFNRNTGVVFINNEMLQQDLIHMFGINGYELNDIFIPWLEKNYNLHVDEVRYGESPFNWVRFNNL